MGKKLAQIMSGLRGSGLDVYVIIDEYDNFTNTILAESGQDAYDELCHGDGFFKQFFTDLKTLTNDFGAPLKRLFITGVSPVTMDDVTSGFNIGTNISLDPQFADFTGFRHDDLRAIADYYGAQCGFDADKAYNAALTWFDNCRFGSYDAPPLANTTLVLCFFSHLWRTHQFPSNMVDVNLRTDYAKIRHLITVNNRLNGNFHALETIVSDGTLSEQLVESFQAKDITVRENFVSLLYWLGITTIVGNDMGTPVFGIPNGAFRQMAAVSAILISAGGPYYITREREANGGFYDLSLAPRFDMAPKIAHAALIELKYVKAGDPAPPPEMLADIKAKAIDQLDRYSSDPALIAAWHLGTVALHRLVLVFHGGDCVLSEEV